MASLFKKREYESVHPDDHTLCDVKPRAPLQYVSALMHLGCVLLGLGVGWVIGFNTCSDVSSSCWLAAPLSTIPAEVAWPRTPKAFNPDERYIGPSKEVDDQWRSLVDSDAIYIGNPHEYRLGKGMKPPPQYSQPNDTTIASTNFYFVSNLHQIHCLDVIRRRYWLLMAKGYNPNDFDADDWGTHVDHCIEYLRLGITCGDLLVVEPDSPPGTWH